MLPKVPWACNLQLQILFYFYHTAGYFPAFLMQSKTALCFTLPAAQWVSSFQK